MFIVTFGTQWSSMANTDNVILSQAYISQMFNLLKPTGHVMHQQFNIQQLYALPHTVFMCFVFI